MKKSVANVTMMRDIEVFLNEGRNVTLLVKGYSMLPFIIGWIESVELQRADGPLKKGDIILAKTSMGIHVLHRIIGIEDDGKIILMGDGNLRGTERCKREDVIGKAVNVINSRGEKTDPYSNSRKLLWKIWWKLLPIRRYLLAIYRRTILKMHYKKTGIKTKGWKVDEEHF